MKQGESLNRIIWGIPLSFLILRIVMQGILFPWELSGDEAQYWLWSQTLDLGYYSKPPLLAWFLNGYSILFGDSFVFFGSYYWHYYLKKHPEVLSQLLSADVLKKK